MGEGGKGERRWGRRYRREWRGGSGRKGRREGLEGRGNVGTRPGGVFKTPKHFLSN